MSKAKELLEDLNKFNEGKEFKTGDIVVYLSQSGPSYHCFAEYIGPMEDNKISIRLLCKIDGRIDVSDVCDNDECIITVNDYQVTEGKERLQKKIQILKDNLFNLEELNKRQHMRDIQK